MLVSSSYQAYVQNSVVGGNPVELVVALYEGAIEATRLAKRCLETGDIWGRSKAISKAHSLLTELLVSVNEEKGLSLAKNLKRLYVYLQFRLLEAHQKKSRDLLDEVERLLGTLLEGWRVVAAKSAELERMERAQQPVSFAPPSRRELEECELTAYSAYFRETANSFGAAFTF